MKTKNLFVILIVVASACGYRGEPVEVPSGWEGVHLSLLAEGSNAFASDGGTIIDGRCGIDTSGAAFCRTTHSTRLMEPVDTVDFSALQGAVALSVGDYRLCGILPGDTLRCVPTTYRPAPGDDFTTPNVQQVDQGFQFCTVSGGVASCEDFTSALPTGNTRKVGSGGSELCHLSDDGTLRCEMMGTLSDVADFEVADDQFLPGQDSDDDFHACALMKDGGLRCWGTNFHGQLGDGTMGPGSLTPTLVPGLGEVAQVALARQHSCVLTAAGDAICWGNSAVFESGYGTRPASVPGATGMARLSAGEFGDCGLRLDGTLACWGGD